MILQYLLLFESRSATANVFVSIDDVNDECPEFTSPAISFGQITRQDAYVVSNTTLEVLVLQAQDMDAVSWILWFHYPDCL